MGVGHKFHQLMALLTIAIRKNLEMLRLRCIRTSNYVRRLNSALNALNSLNRTKNALVIANTWLIEQVVKDYSKDLTRVSMLMSEGRNGLVKAVNRFDFASATKFPSYAKWWIKHQIIKSTAEPVSRRPETKPTEA